MKQYYSTVSVETARQNAVLSTSERLRPLILVVDDEPIITETLAAILNGKGLAVLTAANGAEALEIARIIPPEVLITDVAMPGINGIDLALEMIRTISDCEIIVFSGQASTMDVSGALRESGRDCVTMVKPVHPSELIERVFDLLAKRGSDDRPPMTPRTPSLYEYVVSAGEHRKHVPAAEWTFTMREKLRPGSTMA